MTTRTIQRIERGQRPGLETAKALAAVFEVDLSLLQPEESQMDRDKQSNSDEQLNSDEQAALLYARRVKEFYEFLVTYLVMAVVFLAVFHGQPVVYIIFAAIGVALVVQGLIAFEVISFMSPGWERRLVERKLGRKL